MSDPLADVICWAMADNPLDEDDFTVAAQAVRAHLAAVLDAEEALVGTFSMRPYDVGRLDVLARIRSALGLSAPRSLPGTDGPTEPVAGDTGEPRRTEGTPGGVVRGTTTAADLRADVDRVLAEERTTFEEFVRIGRSERGLDSQRLREMWLLAGEVSLIGAREDPLGLEPSGDPLPRHPGGPEVSPVEDEDGDLIYPNACPECGSDVRVDLTCHTWGGKPDGTGWMSCLPCDSATLLWCSADECRWDYTDGLNPGNPRSVANAPKRPTWLVTQSPPPEPVRRLIAWQPVDWPGLA